MAGEKEKGLSKVNTWVPSKTYKPFRVMAIRLDRPWSKMLEEAMNEYMEKNGYRKED